MFSIRQNIIFSVMAHSILLAAVLLIGGSSEIRKAGLMTVLLSDEKEGSSPSKQAAPVVVKQTPRTLAAPRTAVIPKTEVKQKAEAKTVTKISAIQEMAPIQNPASLAPVMLHSDTDRDSASEATGIEAPDSSSHGIGRGSSSVSSQTFGSSRGEAGAGEASASRGKSGQAIQAGDNHSLKQKIRDTLQKNLVYPYLARKRRMEGTVLVDFWINHKGSAEHVRVLKGSGYAMLDSSAMETVVKSSPFPLADYSIEVPITYRLTQD